MQGKAKMYMLKRAFISFEKKLDKCLVAIATEEIVIDLGDGVKVNYEKFYRSGKGVLVKRYYNNLKE